ncbi:sensory histidine kinase DcuS [compost metagenome]
MSQESVGSGLGLYIVKETIGRLGGEIEVESELEKGTKITIEIPNRISTLN